MLGHEPPEEARVARPRLDRHEVGLGKRVDPARQPLGCAPPRDRLACRRRTANRQPLVGRDVPSIGEVDRAQADAVEIARLLHRLGERERQRAIGARRERALGQHEVLPRTRLGVLPRREKVAHAADAEKVADEPHLAAVPRKEHGTRRDLPLRLGDRVQLARRKVEFGLEDAVRPLELDEVDRAERPRADRYGRKRLPARRRRAEGLAAEPLAADAHGVARADPARVRAHGLRWIGPSAERDRRVRTASRACAPDERRAVDARGEKLRAAQRIEREELRADRALLHRPLRHETPRLVAQLDPVRAADDDVRMPIARGIGDGEPRRAVPAVLLVARRQPQVSRGAEHESAQRDVGELHHRRRIRRLPELFLGKPGELAALPLPQAVVHEGLVRRRLVEHEDVRIAVEVEVAHDHAHRRAVLGGDSGLAADLAEGAVEVVDVELIRRVAEAEEEIEVSVVVEVRERAVDAGHAAPLHARLLRLVAEPAESVGEQQRVVADAADIEVGESIRVDVAAENREDARADEPDERMIGLCVVGAVGARHEDERPRLDHAWRARQHQRAGEQDVESAVAVDVDGDRVLLGVVRPARRESLRPADRELRGILEDRPGGRRVVTLPRGLRHHREPEVAHSRVLELGVARARVRREPLEGGQRRLGALLVAEPARAALDAEFRALEIRVALGGGRVPRQCLRVLTRLLERLRGEVERVRVGRTRLGDRRERSDRLARAAEVEEAEPLAIARAQLEVARRLRREELTEHDERLVLRALARLVERGDRAPERRFRRLRRKRERLGVLRGRGLELETAHEALRVVEKRHRGVVVGDRRRARRCTRRLLLA